MKTFDFSGKHCLVAGGASGMGEAFAQGFAAHGAKVTVADVQLERAQRVANRLRQYGDAQALFLDVRHDSSVQTLAEALQGDVPDILVNSVGIGAKAVPGEDDSSITEIWNRLIDINLSGAYRVCMAVGNLMVGNGGGSIINIASMSAGIVPEKTRPGRIGEYGLMAYCTSKAGIRQLTKAIGVLWAGYNIRANSVSPGYVDTPLTAEPHSNPETRALLESKIPQRKIAAPEDIVGAVLFLASPLSAYITGQDILVDGGFTCL